MFKAHGSAKAVTVKNAIRLSRDYVLADAIGEISKVINSEGFLKKSVMKTP